MGAHILAIKDMAGLCKPYAAELLVKTLKQEIGMPIHFHTHDTAGDSGRRRFCAAAEGLDIADARDGADVGRHQPAESERPRRSPALHPRDTARHPSRCDDWPTTGGGARVLLRRSRRSMLPAADDLYSHEMPGGQYTNLYQQAKAWAWPIAGSEVCRAYAEVNQLFGDIVKVTPTSKVVGDMALFMVTNDLTRQGHSSTAIASSRFPNRSSS